MLTHGQVRRCTLVVPYKGIGKLVSQSVSQPASQSASQLVSQSVSQLIEKFNKNPIISKQLVDRLRVDLKLSNIQHSCYKANIKLVFR